MAGRHRTPGQRYPSGGLRPRRDHGTPEVIAKRLMMVGPGDPALAHYPLGIALARHVITDDQHQAGLAYALAFAVAIGRPASGAGRALSRYLAEDGRQLSEEARVRLTAAWRAYGDALLRRSRSLKDVVDNVAVFERTPTWLVPGHVSADTDLRARARLIEGLDIIARTKAS